VRELAASAAVNPNTMQKALTELERTGLVYTNRTSGRFITEDETLLAQAKKELALAQVLAFLRKMQQFRYSEEEVFALIREGFKET
jgi:DNA-binding transcriptional regulator YhcF (GntR family)